MPPSVIAGTATPRMRRPGNIVTSNLGHAFGGPVAHGKGSPFSVADLPGTSQTGNVQPPMREKR